MTSTKTEEPRQQFSKYFQAKYQASSILADFTLKVKTFLLLIVILFFNYLVAYWVLRQRIHAHIQRF